MPPTASKADCTRASSPTLLHERWQGLHFADTVFPAFLMMMGVSVAIAFGKAKETGVQAADYRKVLWRAFRLVLLGFILVNVDWFADFASTTSRYFGVLQRTGPGLRRLRPHST
ncbi:MAG: heparan-alpha-glucosaminide N-acetyltransferase domain-containing protein [Asticcacaulis sp.]